MAGTATFVRDADTEIQVRNAENDESEEEDLSVEVERKFAVPSDCDKRLEHFGGRLIIDEVIVEEYYDSVDYVLSRNDITLHSRDGEWVLRYSEPRVPNNGPERSHSTVQELSSIGEIIKFLRSRNYVKENYSGQNWLADLSHAGYQRFEKLSMNRKVYGLPSHEDLHPAKISICMADNGHRVGDIEVSVDNNDGIPAALRSIEKLAHRLGFEPLTTVA